MACNPLPPAKRIPGSVGIAAGPEVAIMDTEGNLLERGLTGEIVIRGPNVTAGYENNPKANAEAYTNGWFRTGDQGVMDVDGTSALLGGLKEIISRGGEKISPREVDEILMDHPAVEQVVTFGIPHDKLGEEVGAAVVLREGKTATEKSYANLPPYAWPISRYRARSCFWKKYQKALPGIAAHRSGCQAGFVSININQAAKAKGAQM